MTLAARVTLARTKRGLSKRKLAQLAEVSSGYLTQLENVSGVGAKLDNPTLDVLKRLAAALEVPEEWLAFGTEPEPVWPEETTASTPTGTG